MADSAKKRDFYKFCDMAGFGKSGHIFRTEIGYNVSECFIHGKEVHFPLIDLVVYLR